MNVLSKRHTVILP